MQGFSILSIPFFFLFILIQPVSAQEQTLRVGGPVKEEIELGACPFDSTAPAIVLQEFGLVFPQLNLNDGTLKGTMERHVRIKIFNNEGLQAALIVIPYYYEDQARGEIIKNIRGFTYHINATGGIETTPLDAKTVADVEKDGYERIKTFMLPNVRPGDIIEYSYVKTSTIIGHDWFFQSGIPTLYNQYQLVYGNGFGFRPEFRVVKKLDVENLKLTMDPGFSICGEVRSAVGRSERRCITFARKNVPRLKIENLAPPVIDLIERLHMYLLELKFGDIVSEKNVVEWSQFVERELTIPDYGVYMTEKGALKKIVVNILSASLHKTRLDSLDAICRWVAQNIRSSSTSAFFADISPSDLLGKKRGNSVAINISLIALLRNAGIDANPVLLSTRSHGAPSQNVAVYTNFNYTAAAVKMDTGYILMDAAHKDAQAGLLPFEALNGKGLWMDIKTKGYKWILLTNYYKFKTWRKATLEISTEGDLRGALETSKRNYASISEKKLAISKGADALIREEYGALLINGQITSQEVGAFTTPVGPLQTKITFSGRDFIRVRNETIYVDPMLCYGISENPFMAETRNAPIDFGPPCDQIFEATFAIPAGYRLEAPPKPVAFQLGEDSALRFDYKVDVAGGVKINTKLSIRRAVFDAEEYTALKKWMEQVIAKQKEQIVLNKVK